MMIHDITAKAGKYKARKRVGRGEGSGHGKQSGRGHKGAGSRSGTAAKIGFEGGQMRYFRRMPKFGFTNVAFKTKFWTVNLSDIIAHADFSDGGKIDSAALIKAGLVRDDSRDLKILGHLVLKDSAKDSAKPAAKSIKVKFEVEAARVSASARQMIIDAGGKVNETGTRRDVVRGVDRNSEDKAPKNLTKKLTRSKTVKAPVIAEPEEADAKGKAKAKKPAATDKLAATDKPAAADKSSSTDKAAAPKAAAPKAPKAAKPEKPAKGE